MKFCRLGCLKPFAVCLLAILTSGFHLVMAQAPPAAPQQQPPAPAKPKPANPFETVPQTQGPAPEAAKPTPGPKPAADAEIGRASCRERVFKDV